MYITARLPLVSLFEYDETLFDGITLPDGAVKDNFIDMLIMEAGEMGVWISNPDYLKRMITSWAKGMQENWKRVYQALTEEYNPLHNYDRHEEWEDLGKRVEQTDDTYNGTTKFVGGETHTVKNTDTRAVSAYNSSAFENAEQVSGNGSDALTFTDRHNDTNYGLGRQSNIDNTANRKGRAYGNIGVTTSAQMLTGEIEVRQKDFYEIVVNQFIRKFCIMVY